MKDFLSILLWLPVMTARWFLVALGMFLVPASLVADGVNRTPPLWKFWADAESVPEWWTEEEVPSWSLAYPILMAIIAWWSYDHWYALITIWLIFCSFFSAIIAFSKDRWTKFWWFAIRNPTHGLTKYFEQPIKEPRPNPDDLVYGGKQKSASRWLRHEWFSEFWYLRAVGKKKFEFRIGWKYADGTPGFTPTVQLRLGA
jgi:hypothetical protein